MKIFLMKISERLGLIFSKMIFSHGFVHCDPHPGNVMINPISTQAKGKSKRKEKETEFEIVLLDHGLYQV